MQDTVYRPHSSKPHFGLFGGCHEVVSHKYTTLCITFFPHSLLRKGRGFVTRSLLSQGSSKGCGPYMVTILNSTPIFKWSMTSLITRLESRMDTKFIRVIGGFQSSTTNTFEKI